MRRLLTGLVLMGICLGTLVGCNTKNETNKNEVILTETSETIEETKKLSIVTTIFPQYDIVRKIGGDNVEVKMLLSPGAESHSYDPTPQDIITIQNSDVFIYVGGDSDEWVDRILASMDTEGKEIIALMDLVDVVEEEFVEGMEHGHSHDDDEHDDVEYDEHVWTSPKNAIRIVEAITNVLSERDEANAEIYATAASQYIGELEEVDLAFREVVEGAARTTLIVGDRFPFRYFVDEYGLTYYAAFSGCATETDASAATVAFLIDKAKEEEVPAIFHIELSAARIADTICEETGAQKVVLHSGHNITKDEFEAGIGYLDILWQNVENLKIGLQ